MSGDCGAQMYLLISSYLFSGVTRIPLIRTSVSPLRNPKTFAVSRVTMIGSSLDLRREKADDSNWYVSTWCAIVVTIPQRLEALFNRWQFRSLDITAEELPKLRMHQLREFIEERIVAKWTIGSILAHELSDCAEQIHPPSCELPNGDVQTEDNNGAMHVDDRIELLVLRL